MRTPILMIFLSLSIVSQASGAEKKASPKKPDPVENRNLIVGPRDSKGYSLAFRGEFLYWYWEASTLEYVSTGRGLPNAAGSTLTFV